MTIKVNTSTANTVSGRLADVELVFSAEEGILSGLKLIGFAVWQRRGATGLNVTFPARQYSVNDERRSFALLRPAADYAGGPDRLRDAILEAYAREIG